MCPLHFESVKQDICFPIIHGRHSFVHELCNTTIMLTYSSYESISGVNVHLTMLCFFLSLVFLVVNRIHVAQCLIFANNSWRAIVSLPVLQLFV